ncbi:hypothetical protein G3567_11995 [Psychroflexus sp. YR1-1]|uniref:Uncharacterized protein n=1 Tax=Psychroflexus aurantiacus TaxID=2709310 RepID=A0A6B3R6Q2_9FLAO|nr:hypothetical protein [Psychroflexus aurantiacus]NEV94865.1 hypothetical protein [Psychroflexus aurantiacus]
MTIKTKLNIYAFILLLLCTTESAFGQECNYDSTDINVTLNGWDIDRTDYTHERFIEVAGLEQNSQLDYGGEKDTEEFGYPWYYYYLGNNYIHFAGITEDFNYNGLKRINSFVIKERGVFHVNGIQVGDTESALKQAFSEVSFCTKSISSRKKALFFRYEYFTLGFVISTYDHTILEIELYAPI